MTGFQHKVNIAILVYPGMTALDAIGPYEVLNGIPDVELHFVWKTVGPVVTDSGVLVIGAMHTFDQIKQTDVVVVPGSSADTPTMTLQIVQTYSPVLCQSIPGTTTR